MLPDNKGYFGDYGGRFVPETLVPALDELVAAYKEAKTDTTFWTEFDSLSHDYSGRPTPLYLAKRLSRHCLNIKRNTKLLPIFPVTQKRSPHRSLLN